MSRISFNRPASFSTNSSIYSAHSPFNDAVLTKTVNEFEDDLLTGRLNGRSTGFTGGYTSAIANSPTAVMPSYSGWVGFVPLPPPVTGTGAANIQMASSSIQDSPTGTGVFLYIVFYLDLNLAPKTEIVALNGTTPVTLSAKNVYHFQYAFPISPGSGFSATGAVTSNIGTIWLGVGTFSGSTGFATNNYMWNRPGDGFISSSVYVVPKDKLGSLWSVKLNSDSTVSCLFRTYSRSSRTAAWSLNAEDNISQGSVIKRSLSGGFLPAGAEFTVLGNRTSGTNISCNFVLTAYEFSARCFSQGNADF